MKYVRVNILVEGFTEETFVRDLLRLHLAAHGVYATARSVETASRRGIHFRGGMSRYAKARRDIARWLAEDRSAYLTTMFDLYRLPVDFPGYSDASNIVNPYRKARHIEAALADDVAEARFIPHVQLHEFEGLLFSDVQAIDSVLSTLGAQSRLKDLAQIRASVGSPEEINDGADTAPSKRLITLYPPYDKVVFGSLIAERIGLAKMRAECSHFDAWMAALERLTPLGEVT